jgi:hypothetical protein
MTTSQSSLFVAYLAVHPFHGDATAKQLSFPAGATIMAQPTSEQGGWIWSSIMGPGGVVMMGWSPIPYLSPLYNKGPPPAPSSTGIPFYAEQGNPQVDEDNDWGFDEPIMGGEAANTNTTKHDSSPPELSSGKRSILSGVRSRFREASSSVTGVALKNGSVLTGTAKKTGSATSGVAKKTGMFVKDMTKETGHRLQDIRKQSEARNQGNTAPQQPQQVVYQKDPYPVKQRSTSDQRMVDTGNGAAQGAVVGAAWGVVTGRGAMSGATVGGTVGSAHGFVRSWKPCG